MNNVSFVGNVGKAEINQTKSGQPVLNFTLAVRRSFKRENQPDTDWFKCVMYGKRADALKNYIQKGAKIGVNGKAEWSEFTDRNGAKRKDLSVLVENLTLIATNKTEPTNHQPAPAASNEIDYGGWGQDMDF